MLFVSNTKTIFDVEGCIMTIPAPSMKSEAHQALSGTDGVDQSERDAAALRLAAELAMILRRSMLSERS